MRDHEPRDFERPAFGHVLGGTALDVIAFLSLVPLAWRLRRAGGLALGLGALHAALFLFLPWRDPVPAPWVFLLPNLVGRGPRIWLTLPDGGASRPARHPRR